MASDLPVEPGIASRRFLHGGRIGSEEPRLPAGARALFLFAIRGPGGVRVFPRVHGEQGRSRAGRGSVGIEGLTHAKDVLPQIIAPRIAWTSLNTGLFSGQATPSLCHTPPCGGYCHPAGACRFILVSSNGRSLPGTPNAFVFAVSQEFWPAIVP